MKKNSGGKKITTGIEDPGEERIQGSSHDEAAMISRLLGEYGELIRFSLDSMEETTYHTNSPFVRGDMAAEAEKQTYRQMVDAFANHYVLEEDRVHYVNSMNIEKIRKKLEENGEYSFRFRARVHDEHLWFESKVMDRDALLKNNELVLLTRNVDEYVKKEEQRLAILRAYEMKAVIDVLAEEYTCVVCVDPTTDETSIYRWNEAALGRNDRLLKIKNFTKWLDVIQNRVVLGPDREAFFDATRKEKILKSLYVSNNYRYNFRISTMGEKVENWQMRCVFADPEKGKMVCGFRNIDAEIESEIKKRKEIERQVSVTTAQLKEHISALNKMSEGTLELLGEIVEYRDAESGEHVKRVKKYTYILADMVRMALPEYGLSKEDVEMIVMASALHDLGKIAIPDNILLKPGRLTDEEFEVMKLHSEKGADLIKGMENCWSEKYIKTAYDICLCHHEKWDGRGYPKGLKGDEIPISAQIVTVADCYDALTSERVYKHAYTPEIAFDMIVRGECGKLSEKILSCLKLCRDPFEQLAREGIDSVVLPQMQTRIYEESDSSAREMTSSVHTSHERLNALIAGLSQEYDYVCHINYHINLVTPYHISGRFADEYPELWSDSNIPPENLDVFFNRFVLAEDMPSFMAPLERTGAMAYLEENQVLAHRFRGRVNDQTRYFDIKFIKDESDSGHIVMVILDVDDIVKERRKNIEIRSRYSKMAVEQGADSGRRIADLFLNNYIDAYYVDLKGNSMIVCRQNQLITDRYGFIDDYAEFSDSYIRQEVLAEDRQIMLKAASADFIREYLAEHESMSVFFRKISPDGFRWLKLIISRGYDEDHAALGFVDADEYVRKQQAFEEMENLLKKDPLTAVGSMLAYRELVMDVDRVISAGIMLKTAIIFCDVDNLKEINDSYGHAAGDEHIKKCTDFMRSVCTRSRIFRIGGDEFIIVLEGKDFDRADELYLKLRECEYISSGMALFDPSRDMSIKDTQKRADEIMYEHKGMKHAH